MDCYSWVAANPDQTMKSLIDDLMLILLNSRPVGTAKQTVTYIILQLQIREPYCV